MDRLLIDVTKFSDLPDSDQASFRASIVDEAADDLDFMFDARRDLLAAGHRALLEALIGIEAAEQAITDAFLDERPIFCGRLAVDLEAIF